MSRITVQSRVLVNLTWALFIAILLSACSPLQQGWGHFEKGEWDEAAAKWAESEQPELQHRAHAAKQMMELNAQAEKTSNKQKANQLYIDLVNLNKWTKEKENWLEKNKDLLAIYDKAQKAVEAARAEVQAAYDRQINCGKENFNNEEYQKALDCFADADKNRDIYRNLWIKTDDVSALIDASKQAIEIQQRIEEERRQAEIARQKALEEERQRIEAMRIAEEEKKRLLEEEKKRKWQEFLAKGKPFKPLVTTVGIPAKGSGTLKKRGAKQKWQGGARLPTVKKKKLRAEDIYALEIVVPKYFRVNYLRNYSKSKGSLLKSGQNIGGRVHYYSEAYKGGRFYTEVERVAGQEDKYDISATIYKIPVIH